MIIVIIDIGLKNLSWIVVELPLENGFQVDMTKTIQQNSQILCETIQQMETRILDWHRGNVVDDEEKVTNNIGYLLVEYVKKHLCEPFLKNQNVFYVVELQVSSVILNVTLENVLRSFLKSGGGGVQTCLGYQTLHSKSKFTKTQEFFDKFASLCQLPFKFPLPNSQAHNMKSASERRVESILHNYDKNHEVLRSIKKWHIVNFEEFRKVYFSENKQNDRADVLIGLICVLDSITKHNNHEMIISYLNQVCGFVIKKRKKVASFYKDEKLSVITK